MASLGRVTVEAIVHHYGRDEILRRLAHPFWFQSFGAVMGMDWHSSGITTSILGALKRGLQPVQSELGLYVCGGRGRHSRKTPAELAQVGEKTGLDAEPLARASRLVAKVDSAAVQDGFDLYLHGFVVTSEGRWCVVQQGMSDARGEARRYHWLSENLDSFVDSPHAAIEGRNQGKIINLADVRAEPSRRAGLELVHAGPDRSSPAALAADLRPLPQRFAAKPERANRVGSRSRVRQPSSPVRAMKSTPCGGYSEGRAHHQAHIPSRKEHVILVQRHRIALSRIREVVPHQHELEVLV
jgi:hypothetical protein